MSADRRAFVEEYGVMFEQLGSTRMLGRVWAALMVAALFYYAQAGGDWVITIRTKEWTER